MESVEDYHPNYHQNLNQDFLNFNNKMELNQSNHQQQQEDNLLQQLQQENDDTDDEEIEDENDEKDPFSLKCRIPLPNIYGNYTNIFDTSTFIKRRNERERTRVRNVNDGFERLRNHLPLLPNQRDKRLSKVETLRLAISYIKHLENLLKI